MIQTRTSQTSASIVAGLLDTQLVTKMLTAQANVDWPGGAVPTDVRVERAWPTRGGGFNVEWSILLGQQRVSLFGQTTGDERDEDVPEFRSPVLSPDGLRGLRVPVSELGVRLQSIDHDSAMPHLAKCLDAAAMRDVLSPYLEQSAVDGSLDQRTACVRTLAYRLGRRATLAFGRGDRVDSQPAVLGKTYRDDRGVRLMRLHSELDGQLNSLTDGAVRVPVAHGYAEDLRMVLFAPSAGILAPLCPETEVASDRAVDVLCALHQTNMPGLPTFGLDDELAVVTRWYGVIELTKPKLLEEAASLVSAIRQAAPSTLTDQSCTVHRDFYHQQLLIADKTTTLLDLDTLARGRACVDIANYLTHAYLAALLADDKASDFQSEAARLLRRYQKAGMKLHRNTLAFYWATALFRVGAVHSLRTATAGCVSCLWRLASDVLDFGAGRDDNAQPPLSRSELGFEPSHVLGMVDA